MPLTTTKLDHGCFIMVGGQKSKSKSCRIPVNCHRGLFWSGSQDYIHAQIDVEYARTFN